jgi:FkbM family methyltransferase
MWIYKFYSYNITKISNVEYIDKISNFTKPGYYPFLLNKSSFKIYLDPENGCVDNEIVVNGVFERDMLMFIKSKLTSNSVFLDIGANIGQHSLFASRFCKQVYTFEPITKLYNQIQKSIAINQYSNIQTYNCGLGNTESKKPIYSFTGNMGASSLISSENRFLYQTVNIKRLDDFCIKEGITKANFIKIDVEGYEYEVLLGAEQFILKNKPNILLEYSPFFYNKNDNSTSKYLYTFLVNKNYTIYDIGEGTQFKKITMFEELPTDGQTNIYCAIGD